MFLMFVYGTLKKGGRNHGLLCEAEYEGKATIKGTMYNIGWFPGVVADGDTTIHGEVYLVPSALLPPLDCLEGYTEGGDDTHNMYVRELCSVTMENGDANLAFVYFWNEERTYPIIETGVWKEKE